MMKKGIKYIENKENEGCQELERVKDQIRRMSKNDHEYMKG